jgi:outer membrane protein
MKAASESYKATKRKYDNGAASILEILNSQKLLAESRIERLQAINAWEVARVQLVCSAGNLTAANVQAQLAHIVP